MNTRRRHDLRGRQLGTPVMNQPKPDPDDPVDPDDPTPEPEPEPEPTPSDNTILPQIVYYKDYTLRTDGLDNISIVFDSEEDKKNFELALMNRIWNKKETSLDYYSSHGFKWLYGINKDGELTNVNVLIGLTSLEQTGQPTRMYMFIYSFSQVTVRGILRIHQVILPCNTSFYTKIDDQAIYYGIYSINTTVPPIPLFGFYKLGDDQAFYLPRYSFYLQGKHEDVISPLVDEFNGRFAIDFPSIKV